MKMIAEYIEHAHNLAYGSWGKRTRAEEGVGDFAAQVLRCVQGFACMKLLF